MSGITLATIPENAPIVNKDGTISVFFRLRWEQLRLGSVQTATIAGYATPLPIAANLPTTTLYTVIASGTYRVSWYVRKTVADGVSSSTTVQLNWADQGAALGYTAPAFTIDTNVANDSGSRIIRCDANTDITAQIAYASNTPGMCKYESVFTVEFLS